MRGSQNDSSGKTQLPSALGGLLRFDRSLSICFSVGGAREHKGDLFVTVIYVRCLFENVATLQKKILLRKLAFLLPTSRDRFRAHASTALRYLSSVEGQSRTLSGSTR